EAIGELAERVGIKERRADEAELRRCEDAGVDHRRLHHADGETAGVNQAIAQGDRQHHAPACRLEYAVDLFLIADQWRVRSSRERLQKSSRHALPPYCYFFFAIQA